MSISPDNESLIIRWIFGEIIYNHNSGQRITQRRNLDWALNTRFQKILFHVAQEQNLPITRSWYMYGGYVHTPMLEPTSFNDNVIEFSRNPQEVLGLRSKIRALGISIDDILFEIEKQTSFFTSMSTRELLPLYYSTHTPTQYRDLYVSKQAINDTLSDFSTPLTYNINHFDLIQDTFLENLYKFNVISSEYLQNDGLERIKDEFYTLINTALDKLEVYVLKVLVPDQLILSFISSLNEFNNEHIWRPLAARVSQRTITGFREREEKNKMAEREEYSINTGKEEIRSLRFRLERENIEPTFREYKILHERSRLDKEVRQAIGDLVRLYRNSVDEDG